jgi:hypothetical protein
MEIALLIDGPVSSATVGYLHAPMLVVRWDCERKCDGSRQHYSAKDSKKERAHHIHFLSITR